MLRLWVSWSYFSLPLTLLRVIFKFLHMASASGSLSRTLASSSSFPDILCLCVLLLVSQMVLSAWYVTPTPTTHPICWVVLWAESGIIWLRVRHKAHFKPRFLGHIVYYIRVSQTATWGSIFNKVHVKREENWAVRWFPLKDQFCPGHGGGPHLLLAGSPACPSHLLFLHSVSGEMCCGGCVACPCHPSIAPCEAGASPCSFL